MATELRFIPEVEVMQRAVELMKAIAPAFERCAEGEIDAPSAIRLCAMGQAHCLIGEENGALSCLIILELIDYPLKRVCNMIAYAGTASKFMHLSDVIFDWARANGAVELRGSGKEPQMRLARLRGFREIYRVYAKEL